MTDAAALTLRPGDRIRHTPPVGIGRFVRDTFIVWEIAATGGGVQIVTVEGIRFLPWEVERVERERRR